MVSETAKQRILHAVPLVAWTTLRIATYYAPSLLRVLALRFDLADDPPLGFRQEHEEHRRRIREAGANPDPATAVCSELVFWKQVLLFPWHLCQYYFRVMRKSRAHTNDTDNGSHRPSVPLRAPDLLRRALSLIVKLLPLLTSHFVHASASSCFSSCVSYIVSDLSSMYCHSRHLVTDLLAAAISSTVTNALLQYSIRTLDREGCRAASAATQATSHSWCTSVFSLYLYLASYMALQLGMYTPFQSSMGSILKGSATTVPTSQEPAAFFCGGDGFTYALSGFRFAYRGDAHQLQWAAWSYIVDSSDAGVRLLFRKADPIRRDDNPHTTRSPAGDIFFTATSSLELQQTNIVFFASGALAGVLLQNRYNALNVMRHTPLVGSLLRIAFPLPLGPIEYPPELFDAILEDSSVIRVIVFQGPCSEVFSAEESERTLPTPPSLTSTVAVQLERHGGTTTLVCTIHEKVFRPPCVAHADQREPVAITEGVQQQSLQQRTWIDIAVPAECYCPITRMLMSDPVTTSDGFTYDRESIEEWLKAHATSPMTNLPLETDTLVPNAAVRRLLEELLRLFTEATRFRHNPSELADS